MRIAGRVLMRLLVGRVIGDRLRIEDDDVGEVARLQPAAILDAQRSSPAATSACESLLRASIDVLVAHVLAEQRARSCHRRAGACLSSGTRPRSPSMTASDPKLTHGRRDLPLDVVLGHQEVDDLHAAAVLDDEIHRRVLRRLPAHRRDLGERLAGVRPQRLVLEADEQRALRRRRPAAGSPTRRSASSSPSRTRARILGSCSRFAHAL